MAKHFGKAVMIREMLRDKAQTIIEEYMDVAARAKDAGDYETAQKALQWLIEHLPADSDGVTFVDTSIDKQKQIGDGKSSTPQIQIGIQVGGINTPKQLPQVTSEVIDVEKS